MTIRLATDADLAEILAWSKQEFEDDIHGSFYCNANVIRFHHREGSLHVWADPASDKAVAYLTGPVTGPDIMAVKSDRRGEGIGSMLADYMIQQAVEADVPVIEIECAPETSIPFWEGKGFTIFRDQYAYKIIEKRNALPDGRPVSVRIGFYPERYKRDQTVAPYHIFEPDAVQIQSDVIVLGARATCFYDRRIIDHDVVVRIDVDGQTLYADKAKYEEAREMGVEHGGNCWYLDNIYLAD